MGIHGIYREIGSGRRIALSKFALDTFISKKRPLRLAVDISIWLFQIKASKGGEQPALRTFYYRLLRLTSLAINPLFVFDGPNKPKFKRNRHTGPNVCTVPEFLAKQLLKEFGLPYHVAPGEAEAECAQLQRAGIVDAVLSEDVDTIMFGSRVTMRNWTAESKGKIPTHVNVYDSQDIKHGSSGLDKQGMILVAMMSGGDYIPEGIPGCGPKTACEAARAGFGAKLCKIDRSNDVGFESWKAELAHELKTNESKFFRVKHGALQMPESFPNRDILRYYTHPAVSSVDKIRQLGQSIIWQQPMQLPALRKFTEEAFKWETIVGAKKFIRTLAPALLVRELITNDEEKRSGLLLNIHSARQHSSTDETTELRVSYVPSTVVNIDLSAEPPECSTEEITEGADEEDIPADEDMVANSTQMRPYLFDPSEVTKAWIFEHFVQIGARQQYADWQKIAAAREGKKKEQQTSRAQNQSRHQKSGIDATMPSGALHPFTMVTKPAALAVAASDTSSRPPKLPFPDLPASSYSNRQLPPNRSSQLSDEMQQCRADGSFPAPILKDSTKQVEDRMVNPGVRPARKVLARSRTEGSVALPTEVLDLTLDTIVRAARVVPPSWTNSTSKRKADGSSPFGTPRASRKLQSNNSEPITIFSSPTRQSSIDSYFSPSRTNHHTRPVIDAPPSPTLRLGPKTFNLPNMKSNMQSQVTEAPNSQPASRFFSNNESDLAPTASTSHVAQSMSILAQVHEPPYMLSRSADDPVLASASAPSTSVQCIEDVAIDLIESSSAETNLQQSVKSNRECLKPCGGNRQRIRVRESVRGAFAVEDTQSDITVTQKPVKGIWQMQQVSVVDLTAD